MTSDVRQMQKRQWQTIYLLIAPNNLVRCDIQFIPILFDQTSI